MFSIMDAKVTSVVITHSVVAKEYLIVRMEIDTIRYLGF